MTMLYITSCQGAAGNYQPYVAASFLMYPDGMAASLGDDSSTLLYVYIVFFLPNQYSSCWIYGYLMVFIYYVLLHSIPRYIYIYTKIYTMYIYIYVLYYTYIILYIHIYK